MLLISFQVPKEKRLLPVPKVVEITEEQEKRSVNLGLSVSQSRMHMYRQKDREKNAKHVVAGRHFSAVKSSVTLVFDMLDLRLKGLHVKNGFK